MWADSMDPTRFVKVVKHVGNVSKCRVFFASKGRFEYAGNTDIPTALFGDPETDPFILKRQGPNFYSRCGFIKSNL